MKIILYSSNSCSTCKLVERQIREIIARSNEYIDFSILDIQFHNPGFPVIVPAVFVEGELFSVGHLNIERFNSALNHSI